MNPPVKLDALIQALDFDSDEHTTYIDRSTGRVETIERDVLDAAEEGDDDRLADLPDWQREEADLARAIVADTGDRFLPGPDKFEFHEYRHMERFIGTITDEAVADDLWRAIKGKGAFRFFKDTLHRHGIEKSWYHYRDAALKTFVIDWAEAHGLAVINDTRPSAP